MSEVERQPNAQIIKGQPIILKILKFNQFII